MKLQGFAPVLRDKITGAIRIAVEVYSPTFQGCVNYCSEYSGKLWEIVSPIDQELIEICEVTIDRVPAYSRSVKLD